MSKIAPHRWYTEKAGEAAKFYASIFPDARIDTFKRELVHGELRSFRTAAFSFAGALGGMLVPAAVYLALLHDEPGVRGWGTVMATDTAFVIGGLALLGSRIPPSLRLFLLSLAIFDDVGAILVVAIGYGGALSWSALPVVAALAWPCGSGRGLVFEVFPSTYSWEQACGLRSKPRASIRHWQVSSLG